MAPVLARSLPLDADGVVAVELHHAGRALSWAQVAAALQHDASALVRALVQTGFDGAFWECVPVARDSAARPFRCVVVDSPAVAKIRTDRRPFSQHLDSHRGSTVVSFASLGGDAQLVVPCALGEPPSHAHLLAFLRQGTPEQCGAMWAAVGAAVQQWWRLRTDPVWVSTSGLGVSWLHIRLDERPKYYTWGPFRRFDVAVQ